MLVIGFKLVAEVNYTYIKDNYFNKFLLELYYFNKFLLERR